MPVTRVLRGGGGHFAFLRLNGPRGARSRMTRVGWLQPTPPASAAAGAHAGVARAVGVFPAVRLRAPRDPVEARARPAAPAVSATRRRACATRVPLAWAPARRPLDHHLHLHPAVLLHPPRCPRDRSLGCRCHHLPPTPPTNSRFTCVAGCKRPRGGSARPRVSGETAVATRARGPAATTRLWPTRAHPPRRRVPFVVVVASRSPTLPPPLSLAAWRTPTAWRSGRAGAGGGGRAVGPD